MAVPVVLMGLKSKPLSRFNVRRQIVDIGYRFRRQSQCGERMSIKSVFRFHRSNAPGIESSLKPGENGELLKQIPLMHLAGVREKINRNRITKFLKHLPYRRDRLKY